MIFLNLITGLYSTKCEEHRTLDEMARLFFKIFLETLPLANQTSFAIKMDNSFHPFATRERIHLLLNEIEPKCKGNAENSHQIDWEITIKYSQKELNFRVFLIKGKAPSELSILSFEFTKSDGSKVTSFLPENMFSLFHREAQIEVLVNGYVMAGILDASVRSIDTGSIPRLFTNTQVGSQEDGFTEYTLRRTPNPALNSKGLIRNLTDGVDVVLMNWRESVGEGETSWSVETQFRFIPQEDLPPDFQNMVTLSISEEEFLKKSYFFGFEGIQIASTSFKNDSNQDIRDGTFLFDVMNSNVNESKVSLSPTDWPGLLPGSGQLTERFFLARVLSENYFDRIQSDPLFDPSTLKSPLNQLLTSKKAFISTEKVLRVCELLVRQSTLEVFDNLLLFKAEQEMKKSGEPVIQFVKVSEQSEDEQTQDKGFLESKKVYEFRLLVKFDQKHFNHRELPERVSTNIIQLNSILLRIIQEPFEQDYFFSRGQGSVLALEFYYDAKEFSRVYGSWTKFFSFGQETDLSTQMSDVSLLDFQSILSQQSSGSVSPHLELVNRTSTPRIPLISDLDDSQLLEERESIIETASPKVQHKSQPTQQSPVVETPTKNVQKAHSNRTETSGNQIQEGDSTPNETTVQENDSSQSEVSSLPNTSSEVTETELKSTEEELAALQRKSIVTKFPYEFSFAEYLKENPTKRHVDRQNIKMAKYFVSLFLSQTAKTLFSEDQPSKDHFLWIPIKKNNDYSNHPIHDFSFQEIQLALVDATIDARVLDSVEMSKRLHTAVDQISFPLKLNNAIYYLVLRFSRRSRETLESNSLDLQITIFESLLEEGFDSPDLEALDLKKAYEEPVDTWQSLIMNKQTMFNLIEKLDYLILKRDEDIPELFFYTENENEEFDDEEKGLGGDPTFVYNQASRTYEFDLVTAPIAKLVRVPMVPGRETARKYEYSDFSSDNHYKIRFSFDTLDLSLDPSQNNYENYQVLSIAFKFEFGACPLEFVSHFKIKDSITCKKVYSDRKYMLEFSDSEKAPLKGDFLTTPSLRMYLLWPEKVDQVADSDLKQRAQEDQVEEVESSTFARGLVYRFIKNHSVHLERHLYSSTGAETSKPALEALAQKALESFKKSGFLLGKSPGRFQAKTLTNILKAVALHENTALAEETGFADCMRNKPQEDQSVFQNFAEALSVHMHKHSKKFGALKKVESGEHYRLKVELNNSAYKGKGWLEYLTADENEDFLKKMEYLEHYEKYRVGISEFAQFDVAQMRYIFGEQATVRLLEGLDTIWEHTLVERLLI